MAFSRDRWGGTRVGKQVEAMCRIQALLIAEFQVESVILELILDEKIENKKERHPDDPENPEVAGRGGPKLKDFNWALGKLNNMNIDVSNEGVKKRLKDLTDLMKLNLDIN